MKILIVAYDLRSSALAGSFRIRKFARYLAAAGNHVEIICAFSGGQADSPHAELKVKVIEGAAEHAKQSFFQRVWTRVISLPDPSARWARKVCSDDYFASAAKSADVLLVSSPPHGIQRIGIYASQKFGLRYFADLRDDIVTNHRIKWRTPLHKKAAVVIENEMMFLAERVILNTEEVRRRFVARHAGYSFKMAVITNGYDFDVQIADKFVDRSSCDRNALGFELVYLGSSYNGFAEHLIAAINERLAARALDMPWQVVTAGSGKWTFFVGHKNWAHLGLLSQEEANRAMQEAGVLLLMMPPGEQEPSGTIPLKAYSYLASNRPIVYIGESGSTTELLAKFKGTRAFRRADVDGLVDWLVASGQAGRAVKIDRSKDIEAYHFSSLAKRLEQLFTQEAGVP